MNGTETWTQNVQEMRKVGVPEMMCLIRICPFRSDKVTHLLIKERWTDLNLMKRNEERGKR